MFIILILSIFLFLTLSVKIEVENLKISIPKIDGKYVNHDCIINLKIYFMNFIKVYNKKIKKLEIKREWTRKQIENLKNNMKQNGKLLDLDMMFSLQKIDLKFEKINLNILVGLDDAAVTAISIGLIYAIIDFFIAKKMSNFQNQRCDIKPIYGKNLLMIEFDGIFNLNVWNIIFSFIKLQKERGGRDVRTSNSRSYVYSNE